MGLVQYALKFRITTYVLAVLMMLGGVGAVVVTPKDVLPTVDIPVVVVVWTYTGLSAPEMEKRITTYSEFGISNNVNNIARMESTSLQGTSIMKVYFDQRQHRSRHRADRLLHQLDPRTDAAGRAAAGDRALLRLLGAGDPARADLDQGQPQQGLRLRPVSHPPAADPGAGSTLPSPFGGAPRQIMVDLDPHALRALGLTALDVTNAVTQQNLTIPSGLAKIGEQQYPSR